MVGLLKIGCLAGCLMVLASGNSQGVWHQRDSVNGPPKASCVGFSAINQGYIGTGIDQLGYKRSFFSYSWIDNDWDKEESMGGASGGGLNRASAIAFTANSRAYIGLGNGTAPYYNDLWEYNPITDTWSQKATFTGSARRDAVAFSIDHIGYVGTGEDANGFTSDFYSYDPNNNTWSSIATFPGTPRKGAVGFAMGGQGYVGTGDDGVFRDDFWQYEPTTDSWTQKSDFPGTRRTGATGWGIFPNAFIATGYDTTLDYTNDVWSYNYFDDTWSQVASIPGPARTSAVSFVIDDRAYLGTGYNGDYLDDFYEYFPVLSVSSEEALEYEVYPNPAQNEIFLQGNMGVDASYRILDLTGKQVAQGELSRSQNISIEEMSRGTYLLMVESGAKLSAKRFIKY